MKVEVVVDGVVSINGLGESPVWIASRDELEFVDIRGKALHVVPTLNTPAAVRSYQFPKMACCGVLSASKRDTLLVALEDSVHEFNFVNGELGDPVFVLPENDRDPMKRFNDGKADRNGRLWIGTVGLKKEKGVAKLYCSTNAGLVPMVEDLTIANGLDWSPDGSVLYLVDSPESCIYAFDVTEQVGNDEIRLENKRVLTRCVCEEFPDALPDGLCVDVDGNLWVAMYGGGCVFQICSKTGEKLRTVSLPACRTSCPVFAGPNLDQMYVTSGNNGAETKDNKPGALFRITDLGTRGFPPHAARY